MRTIIICRLKTCSALSKCALYHGFIFKSETYLPSKLYYNARYFRSKQTFPIDKVIDNTQNKNSEKQRDYRVGRNSFWKEDGEKKDGIWRSTSLKWSSSKSPFAAGNAKRVSEFLKRKETQRLSNEEIQLNNTKPKRKVGEDIQLPERPLSVAEWRELKESVENGYRFESKIMRRLFLSVADLDIAKSLLTFVVTETGTLSYELLLAYLMVCVTGGHDSEVVDVYDIMRSTFPNMETGAYSLFIKSFCRTERWREGLAILQELKKVYLPSASNYCNVISAAMQHNDMITAWALYDEWIERGPHPDTWEALFRGPRVVEKSEKEEKMMPQLEHHKRLLGVLQYMRDNQIYPQKNLAESIKTHFESLKEQQWKGTWTSVTPKGTCGCCGTELESIHLTAEEYQMLKDKVMVDVIQGPDIFKKTTPEELERFEEFVTRMPAFDVVVDGLNVANILKEQRQSDTVNLFNKSTDVNELLAVVSELTRQGLTVLVLGKNHMQRHSKNWDRRNMLQVQQKAHCFFTDIISKDDPFLLYAALHSGNHCKFVSRDLMRDHKACLQEEATRRLFFKWQRAHQLVITKYMPESREAIFLSIPAYDTILQTTGNSWHIPYDDTNDRNAYEVPVKWLCLTNRD